MSYFPSPDPEKLRAAMAQRAAYMQTTSNPLAQEQLFRQYTSQGPSSDGMLLPTSYPSAVPQPRGLGLVPMPETISGPQIFQGKSDAQSMTLPNAWPSDYMTTPMPDVQSSRQDFYDQSYGAPPSTVLPSMLWNNHQGTTSSLPEYDDSPSISAYSASSHASVTCSPYSFSEGYVTAGSPRIKLESSLDHPENSMQALPWTNAAGEPFSVNPGELITKPPGISQRYPTSLPPSFDGTLHSDSEDSKPHFRDSPAARRQSESSDELLDDLCGDRQKREYTKPETANCACDKCGKLFQRSYNLKAHMETHDPHRSQPHPCMYEECDKRFVRRTDLMRHEQSVHLKQRNWECPLCHSSFARKDTLRRHVDDGCPKRPEVRKRSRLRRASNAATTASS